MNKEKIQKINQEISELIFPDEVNLVSDKFHTFGELYKHRVMLYILLCKFLQKEGYYIWKSKLHNDGSKIDGFFILGIGKKAGEQITYHLKNENWELTNFAEILNKAPEYDEHTSEQIIRRLKEILEETRNQRNFNEWNIKKQEIHAKNKNRYFEEREVWFMNVGINVGDEQNGDSKKFLRPVLIFKKFSHNLFLGIPLTKTVRQGSFFHTFEFKNQISTAILSQARTFDSKRIQTSKRYGKLTYADFADIKNKYQELIFEDETKNKLDNLKPSEEPKGIPVGNL